MSENGFSVVYDTAVNIFARFEEQKFARDKLDAEELQALKRAYQARARERYPLPVQLEYAQKPGEEPREDGAFLI